MLDSKEMLEVSFLNQFKHMVLDFKFPCSNASSDGIDVTTKHSSHNHIATGRSRCDNHLGNLANFLDSN